MLDWLNVIIGGGIIAFNIFPFVIKQPKYIFLTAITSMLILFLLVYFRPV